MDTYESLVKVKHGVTTLVSIGDPMWDTVTINGRQAVQVVSLLRSAGVKAIPRKNESNEVSFTLCVEHATIEEAQKAVLAFSITLPRTMQDVQISFADLSGIVVKNASVESWSGILEDMLERRVIKITGGQILAI